MQIGDIITIDGKDYEVTYVDGQNYSYAPKKEEPEPKKEAPKRRRTKK